VVAAEHQREKALSDRTFDELRDALACLLPTSRESNPA